MFTGAHLAFALKDGVKALASGEEGVLTKKVSL